MSRELEAAHRPRGQQYVASPVLGRPDAAAQRQLLADCRRSPSCGRAVPALSLLARAWLLGGRAGAVEGESDEARRELCACGRCSNRSGEAFALIEKAGADVRHVCASDERRNLPLAACGKLRQPDPRKTLPNQPVSRCVWASRTCGLPCSRRLRRLFRCRSPVCYRITISTPSPTDMGISIGRQSPKFPARRQV